MEEKTNLIIKCPFYSLIRKNMIACEGLIDNTCMTTRFPSAAVMREHIGNYCSKENGGKCPLAVNLYEKYDRIEEERVKRAIEKAKEMQLSAVGRRNS